MGLAPAPEGYNGASSSGAPRLQAAPSDYGTSAPAQPKKKGAPSILQQLSDIKDNFVPGLVGAVSKETNLLSDLLVSSPLADLRPSGQQDFWQTESGKRMLAAEKDAYDRGQGTGGIGQAGLEAASPLIGGTIGSVQHLGSDALDPLRALTGRKTNFGKASDEGRTAGKVIEDFGTLAMLAGPLAKAAGASAEAAAEGSRTASVASKIEEGAKAAQHPIRTVSRPLASKAIEGVGAVAEGDSRLAPLANRGIEAVDSARSALAASKERARAGLELRKANLAEGLARKTEQAEGFLRAGKEAKALGVTPTEEAAAVVGRQGRVASIAGAVDYLDQHPAELQALADDLGMTPKEVRDQFAGYAVNEASTTSAGAVPSEVIDALVDEHRGALAPEAKARIDAVRGHLDSALDVAEQRSLEGYGSTSGKGLDPKQLEPHLLEGREGMAAVPAPYRPAVQAGQRATEWLAKTAEAHPEHAAFLDAVQGEVHDTLDSLRDAGLTDDIRHIITSNPGTEGPLVRMTTEADSVSKRGKTHIEHAKRTQATPLTVHGLAKLYNEKVSTQVGNVVGQRMAEMFGRRLEDVIPEVTSMRTTGGEVIRGKNLVNEAKRAGWVPLRDERLLGPMADQIAPDLYVPKGIGEEFAKVFVPADGGVAKAVHLLIDKPVSAWKIGQLALSPRWHVGNIIGNTMLATLSGVAPGDLVRLMNQARHDLGLAATPEELAGKGRLGRLGAELRALAKEAGPGDVAKESPLASAEGHVLHDRAMHSDFYEALSDRKTDPRTRAGAAFRKTYETSFRINSAVDDMTRAAVFLDRVEKGASREAALKAALRAMGDFSDMTAFERNVVRRVVPFYAWQRAITKVAFGLAMDHPGRIAWTAALADRGQDPSEQEALPDWLRGSIHVGGKNWLPLQGLNPLGDVASPLFGGPGEIARSLSPAIKVPAALAGINVEHARPLTAPRGYEPTPFEPVSKETALHQLLGLLPQTRLLRELPGQPIARYETGQPVLKGGRDISAVRPGGKAGALAGFLTGFRPTDYDTAQGAAIAAKREKADAKAQAAYDRKRRQAAGRKPAKR